MAALGDALPCAAGTYKEEIGNDESCTKCGCGVLRRVSLQVAAGACTRVGCPGHNLKLPACKALDYMQLLPNAMARARAPRTETASHARKLYETHTPQALRAGRRQRALWR